MDNDFKTVKQVLLSNNKYNIPSFQRGYRWDNNQVDDLLMDLHSFYQKIQVKTSNGKPSSEGILSSDDKDFYCLQSLIICEDDGRYSVIDGQQRLTTMFILLSYLIKEKKLTESTELKLAEISYDKDIMKNYGEGSKAFLNAMKKNVPNNYDTRDEKHMLDAYDEIKEVCTKEKIRDVHVSGIMDELVELINQDKIKFIQQIYTEKTPIQVFEAINFGKIPLTDAELIRAKIILNGDSKKTISRAKKWDEIEHSLQNDAMYRFLTKKESDDASRIGLLFELLVERAINKTDDTIDKAEKHWVYRYLCDHRFTSEKYNNFNVENGDTFEDPKHIDFFWKKTEDLYEAIYKWYKDVELYNYIGQVMYSGSAELCDIYISYYDKNNRDQFIWELKKHILQSFDRSSDKKSKTAPVWPSDFPCVKFDETEIMICEKETYDLSGFIKISGKVTWESSDPSVAAVDENSGIVAGVKGSNKTPKAVDIIAKDSISKKIVLTKRISVFKANKRLEKKVDKKPIIITPKIIIDELDLNQLSRVSLSVVEGVDRAIVDDNSNVIIRSLGNVVIHVEYDNVRINLANIVGINDPKNYTWESSDKSVAKVNKSGIVNGIKTGKVTISADKNGNKTTWSIDIYNTGWYVDGNPIKTEQDNAGNVIVTTSVDDDKMSELFRPLYYSGRQEDNVGVGDRDAVKYFHIWSNCELLKSQMIKAREKESEIKGDRDEMYRFPFALLISQKVDIEHVDSYVDRAEKGDFRIKDAKEYVKNMYPYLPPEEKTKVDKKRDDFDKYNAILEHFLDTEFGCEKNKNIFETTVIDRRRIANLALLDPGTNRGYGNSPFAVKRGSILRREIEGQYYFPCTKMVFLKEFDPETPNLTRWNKDDYMKHLYFLLNQFVDCFYDAKGKYIMEG